MTTTAGQKHFQVLQDAEKKVTDALQALAIDKELMTGDAWDQFSAHVATYVRDLYKLSLEHKHPEDNNISRSCVSAAHAVLAGRAKMPKVIGALGGAILGGGIALILGVATSTVTGSSSISVWAWACGASLVGLAMLYYQFSRKG